MESRKIAPGNDGSVSDEVWDSWMGFILNEFLVKDCGLHETLKTLQQRNRNVTYAQRPYHSLNFSFAGIVQTYAVSVQT